MFRVRYDKIVDFDPYDDGFGIMKDTQTAKLQVSRTGDGWFPYVVRIQHGGEPGPDVNIGRIDKPREKEK